jgi:hypothetical protein
MEANKSINHVEFPARDIRATETFLESLLGWSMEDGGPEYTAISNQGLDGGFVKADLSSARDTGAVPECRNPKVDEKARRAGGSA